MALNNGNIAEFLSILYRDSRGLSNNEKCTLIRDRLADGRFSVYMDAFATLQRVSTVIVGSVSQIVLYHWLLRVNEGHMYVCIEWQSDPHYHIVWEILSRIHEKKKHCNPTHLTIARLLSVLTTEALFTVEDRWIYLTQQQKNWALKA